ncbi:unnamed protein product [Camellia sinensis]|uniref:LOB domain-containing protein n=1 Tax=Camellia sinensis var. sinensis TaxID=542762 RepID=A0A4S4EUW5_CAMSN|nr:LOB domain-containing protein 39-like [Camellia sinensis]THG20275.1 hypothetical protein TEA_013337 [Camellia sinensis var. sinensis]
MMMSCNGCRVLRRRCGESCILRPCLQWIESPQAQGHATLFVSKFFGRSDLMSFISAVPHNNRPALFQSLLFEACGRTVNPVNGAVGLLSTGNWHICQAAVQTVLSGGTLRPNLTGILNPETNESSKAFLADALKLQNRYSGFDNDSSGTQLQFSDLNISSGLNYYEQKKKQQQKAMAISFNLEESSEMVMMSFGGNDDYGVKKLRREEEPKLLKLFV